MRNYRTYENKEVLNLLLKDNEDAFTELYNRFWKKLFVLAYNRIKEAPTAEDIVHDVFASLWANREKIKIESLENYLDQKNYKPSLQALKYILAEEDKGQTMIVDLSKDPSLLSSVNAQKLVIDYFLNKKEQPGKAGLWIDIANKL